MQYSLSLAKRIYCTAFLWLLLAAACTPKNNKTEVQAAREKELAFRLRAHRGIDSLLPSVQHGDLILRTGNDFTSESLRQLNRRNTTYSHCGIAAVENGQVYVYHAVGGEFNPDQKIRRDPLHDFGEPAGNRGLGIYRYAASPGRQNKLVNAATLLYRAGIPFDMAFSLQTDEKMYCAEYVYKCLLLAAGDTLRCSTSHIGDVEFVGVDDLFLQPLCRKVAEIIYK